MSHLYTKILTRMNESTIPERATQLLRSRKPAAQKAAVDILIEKPSPVALDLLWELRRSLEGDDERFFFRFQVEAALAACVKLAPYWLERVIQRSDPKVEPFESLVYLLVHLADVEGGDRIWERVRETVLKKAQSGDQRALSYVIESFKDRETLSLLPRWVLDEDRDFVPAAALRALELLDPEEALGALEKAPLESSLLMARSWWLPQLLAFNYDRTSEILRQKIEEHEKPWFAAAVYDNRENQITPAILDFLLDVTGRLLEEALVSPEDDTRDPLYRPFNFLADVSRLELLKSFEARRGTRFEEALTEYMKRQGPNDEGWYRWKVWNGISVLQKIGGEGFTQLANHHLQTAQTRLGIRDGFILGIRRPDEATVRLIIQIAHDLERGGQTERGFPLVQYEAVKALAVLGQWKEVVHGCLQLGLRTPRSLPEYLEDHTFTDEELAEALRDLHSSQPSLGAILLVGLSGRMELAPAIRDIYKESERDSEQALACLLALESLKDPESVSIFIENLDSAKNSWVALRALLGAVKTQQSDEVLLDRLRVLNETEGGNRQMLAMNLLIREETRERAARLILDSLDIFDILHYTGDTVEYLAVLKTPEARNLLTQAAFSNEHGIFHSADRHAAIEGLAQLEPDTAFNAAKALFGSDDEDRLLCPETLLTLREEEALTIFHQSLATSKDFTLIAAIGEAIDRRRPAEILRVWFNDPDAKVRQGACILTESLRWSPELEELVRERIRERAWDVRSAARAAYEILLKARETGRLVEELKTEILISRRWMLVDAALGIGYAGVVSGYGAKSWFGSMCEGQPYVLRRYAVDKLKEKRKKFRDELAKRERD